MLSNTKIEQRLRKKTNAVLVETILLAKKPHPEIASALSIPARMQAKINVEALNNSKSDVVIIPGKVLSGGELSKKMKVYALGFSEKAAEKLKKAGCEYKTILEALKNGDKLKGEIIK